VKLGVCDGKRSLYRFDEIIRVEPGDRGAPGFIPLRPYTLGEARQSFH
jgi:hypothetical protein